MNNGKKRNRELCFFSDLGLHKGREGQGARTAFRKAPQASPPETRFTVEVNDFLERFKLLELGLVVLVFLASLPPRPPTQRVCDAGLLTDERARVARGGALRHRARHHMARAHAGRRRASGRASCCCCGCGFVLSRSPRTRELHGRRRATPAVSAQCGMCARAW